MKLETLHEVKYVGAKTLDKVMSYVDEDSSITDGFIMRIKRHYDNTIHYVQYLSVQHYDDPGEEDHGDPYMLVSYFGNVNDSDPFHPEEFIDMVEIYSTKRIL